MFSAKNVCVVVAMAALAGCGESDHTDQVLLNTASRGELNDQNTPFMASGSLKMLWVAEIANQGLNPASARALRQGDHSAFAAQARCQYGGVIRSEIDQSRLSLVYEDCSELGRSLTGRVSYEVEGVGPDRYQAKVDFDRLKLETGGKVELIDGSMQVEEVLQYGRYRLQAQLSDLSISDGQNEFQAVEVSALNEVGANGVSSNAFSGYVVASGVGLSIKTLTPMSTPADQQYPSVGELEVRAVLDGSRVRINADSGSAETALVTMLDADGSVLSELIHWSNL